MEHAFTKEDFSVRELMELQVLAFAKDLFEAMKKQTGFPLEMDNVKVHVELSLLKPIGDDGDLDKPSVKSQSRKTVATAQPEMPINWHKKPTEKN